MNQMPHPTEESSHSSQPPLPHLSLLSPPLHVPPFLLQLLQLPLLDKQSLLLFLQTSCLREKKKCFKNTSTKSCFTAEALSPGSEYLLLPQLQFFHLFAKFFSPLLLVCVPFLLCLFHPLQRLFSGPLVLVFKAPLLLLRCHFLLHVQKEMSHSQQVSKLSQLCTMLMGLSRVDFRPDTVLTADRSTV